MGSGRIQRPASGQNLNRVASGKLSGLRSPMGTMGNTTSKTNVLDEEEFGSPAFSPVARPQTANSGTGSISLHARQRIREWQKDQNEQARI
jgi:hypothetical protein